MDTLTIIDTVYVVVAHSPTESISFWSSALSFTFERVLPVAFAALLGSWMALKKFKRMKYWELRLEAYNELLNALEKMFSYVDASLLDAMHEKTINDDDREQLKSNWKDGKDEVERMRRIGRLLISEEAHQIVDIDTRFKEATKDIQKGNWFAYMDEEWGVLRDVIEDLITQSKKDLGLKS